MKIMYITDQMYLHGGGERVLTNKSNYYIEKSNFQIYIVTSEQKGNAPCYPINADTNFIDLEVNYNRTLSYFHPTNLIKAPKHLFKLRQIIKHVCPDIIVTLSTQFDFYFLPFLYKKIPKIKEFHSSRHFAFLKRQQNNNLLRKIQYKITDWFEAKYDHLVVLTTDELNYFKSNNTLVIPNSIQPANSKPALLQHKTVIAAGRIAPVKGFEHAISAWQEVYQKYPDWQLHIYGDGDCHYVQKLQGLITNYGLEDVVHLKGATQNLPQKMQQASIYLMSSLTECFPMVLLEAKQQGLPIISFDCPNGPRHIINDQIDGILVPNNNQQKMTEALILLITNVTLRKQMGKKGFDNVKNLSEEQVMLKWLQLFHNVTSDD